MTEPLIDAKAAGQLLGVPHTWVLEQARHDRIPHIRLGRYVRFDAEAVIAYARNRSRGPDYPDRRTNSGPRDAPTPGGQTPDLRRRTDAKNPNRRRSYGTGSLEKRRNADGSQSWVAVWREHGRKRKRTLGCVGELSEKSANQRLAELRGTPAAPRATGEQLTVAEVSRRYLIAPARGGRPRKPSTVENVHSETRTHLVPFFGDRPFHGIDAYDVADLIAKLQSDGLAPKTIRNVIGTLSALSNFARSPRRRWASTNPCDGAELPAIAEADEIRFLTRPDLERLIEHARKGMYQEIDRALYLVAAMTGLRLGELVALRWRDVDWVAGVIRVRRNYVRGRYGTPKSRRSSRAVPMADEVGGVLDRLFQASTFQGDDDLVFGHPTTGKAIPKANVTRRLHKALEDAELAVVPDHVVPV